MVRKTHYAADLQDPVTGETTTLTADTEEALDQLVDEYLAAGYPEAEPE